MARKFLFLFLSFQFTSCSFILSTFYGVKNLKKFEQEKCEKFISDIDFKGVQYLQLYVDSNLTSFVKNNFLDKHLRNDFLQPIQMLYFVNDTLKSAHINCYAQGSANKLDWNVDHRFDEFLPKSAFPIDSLNFKAKIYCEVLGLENGEKDKNIVIIHWTRMLEKQSRIAIEIVLDNLIRFKQEENYRIVLVNNDKRFIEV
ncbi:MAG: hypothetical protein H6588_08565 [Flavobacteriales bacterium]|nr:hypothetical protein [Flavobacteriales bacterium]